MTLHWDQLCSQLSAIFLSAKSVFLGLNGLWETRHLNFGLIPKLIFKVLCFLNVHLNTEGGFIRKFQVVFLSLSFLSFLQWNYLRRGKKEHREPLPLNENDFNGYLNSTFKPDLNIKNKKALCQTH